MSVDCVRANCTRKASRQGLCRQHYDVTQVRGDVDGGPTRARIQLLLDRGVGWRGIEEHTGLSVWWLVKSNGRVRAKTEKLIFAIPVPRLGNEGQVSPLGTVRRIQALSCMGWSQAQLSVMLGMNTRYAHQFFHRKTVLASTAARWAALYDELCMTPGPSEAARRTAKKRGWVPPLAWDDIDHDPHPNTTSRKASFAERVTELRDMGVTETHVLAERLGYGSVDSFKRQLQRKAS